MSASHLRSIHSCDRQLVLHNITLLIHSGKCNKKGEHLFFIIFKQKDNFSPGCSLDRGKLCHEQNEDRVRRGAGAVAAQRTWPSPSRN